MSTETKSAVLDPKPDAPAARTRQRGVLQRPVPRSETSGGQQYRATMVRGKVYFLGARRLEIGRTYPVSKREVDWLTTFATQAVAVASEDDDGRPSRMFRPLFKFTDLEGNEVTGENIDIADDVAFTDTASGLDD